MAGHYIDEYSSSLAYRIYAGGDNKLAQAFLEVQKQIPWVDAYVIVAMLGEY